MVKTIILSASITFAIMAISSRVIWEGYLVPWHRQLAVEKTQRHMLDAKKEALRASADKATQRAGGTVLLGFAARLALEPLSHDDLQELEKAFLAITQRSRREPRPSEEQLPRLRNSLSMAQNFALLVESDRNMSDEARARAVAIGNRTQAVLTNVESGQCTYPELLDHFQQVQACYGRVWHELTSEEMSFGAERKKRAAHVFLIAKTIGERASVDDDLPMALRKEGERIAQHAGAWIMTLENGEGNPDPNLVLDDMVRYQLFTSRLLLIIYPSKPPSA